MYVCARHAVRLWSHSKIAHQKRKKKNTRKRKSWISFFLIEIKVGDFSFSKQHNNVEGMKTRKTTLKLINQMKRTGWPSSTCTVRIIRVVSTWIFFTCQFERECHQVKKWEQKSRYDEPVVVRQVKRKKLVSIYFFFPHNKAIRTTIWNGMNYYDRLLDVLHRRRRRWLYG